jgi:hypothetical protein
MRTYLGEFEQLLLFALVHLRDEAYGARIRQVVESRTGRTVGVGPADPFTYLAVIALLCAVGVVASGVPAWRASRIQPITALRAE